jgi:hypothetical protein
MIAEPIHQSASQVFESLYAVRARREPLWARLMRLLRPIRRAGHFQA